MAANRARLSLTELGEFDDLLTDALVDKVYYWTKIRKTKRLYLPNRRVVEKDVAPIVADYVVRARSVTAAVEKFEQLSGVQIFLQGIEEWKRNEFMKHVRRYMQIYHPEAPFEVNSTNRYTLGTHEACIHARRPIRTGETIKFLAGCMLLMTDEEEASLDDNSDFSVICTSRMKGTSVLLGPARFVNHDCDPNCKFITTNKDNITIMAIRNIAMGEEITIKYSEDYFGENNCECLCQTCESRAQNGFALVGGKTETTTAELMAVLEKDSGAYSFRPGKRNTARLSPGNPPRLSKSVSTSTHVELESQLPHSMPTKQGSTLVGLVLTPPQSEAGPTSEDELQSETQPTATIATPEVTPPPGVAKTVTIETSSLVPSNPLASEGSAVEAKSNEQYSDQDDSDCDSELSEIDDAEYQKLLEMFSPSISARYKNKRKRGYEDVQSPSNSLKRTKPSSLERSKTPSVKSQATLQGPSTEKKIKRKRDPEEYQPPPKRSKPQTSNPFKHSFKRFPGDSALVPKIGLKCICTDCGQNFWNPETWYVPMSCNRCLRHSKIYGLRWPKTFKRKNDQEVSNETSNKRFRDDTWDLSPLSESLCKEIGG
ncbi:hypothetical protein EV426DRAFT_274612 [Tirmania nivea]|nr:hypothetical protein EV426DRAFT_274612 [Tirmania nivea]